MVKATGAACRWLDLRQEEERDIAQANPLFTQGRTLYASLSRVARPSVTCHASAEHPKNCAGSKLPDAGDI